MHGYIINMKNINKELPKNLDLFKDKLIFRSAPMYRHDKVNKHVPLSESP